MVVVKGLGGERSIQCMRGGGVNRRDKIREREEREDELTGGKG